MLKMKILNDRILMHPVYGLLIFVAVMWFMFFCTFHIGAYPQEWIDSAVGYAAAYVNGNMPEGWFSSLLSDGVIMGIGSVLAFIPNILILFFFISLLTETGYLPRAALLMDRYMHRIGLHGSSFVPLLMGFGCNVPAIMATRSIQNRTDRILTIMMIPYIPCSARMPTFILFTGIFFPENRVLATLLLYFGAIITGVLMALLMKKTLFGRKSEILHSEPPALKRPSFSRAFHVMFDAAWQYMKKIGTVVLLAVIVVWALDYYPVRENRVEDEGSYLETLGHVTEPVVRPLGLDWKMGVSLIAGITAKEFIISTLGVVYKADESGTENSASLVSRIAEEKYVSGPKAGQHVFNKANALSFMVFALLYMPCVGTAITIRKESGSTKWMLLSIASTLAVAWILSYVAFRIGTVLWL